jgi:hypothetical protein
MRAEATATSLRLSSTADALPDIVAAVNCRRHLGKLCKRFVQLHAPLCPRTS